MSGLRKVKHGTPIHHQPALCETCREAMIQQGAADSEKTTRCNALSGSPFVKVHIIECSSYEDKRQAPIYEMKLMAWKIATDKSGKTIGFLSPSEFRKRQEKEDLTEKGTPLIDSDY